MNRTNVQSANREEMTSEENILESPLFSERSNPFIDLKSMEKIPPLVTEDLEDDQALSRLLEIKPNDNVLTGPGSGDLILNCLIENPKAVFCFEADPMKLKFSKFKLALIQQLSWEEMLLVLGVTFESEKVRAEVLSKVKLTDDLMPLKNSKWWDHVCSRGLLEAGKQAEFLRRLRKSVSALVSKHVLERVLSERDRQERLIIWNEYFNRREIVDFLYLSLKEIFISPSPFKSQLESMTSLEVKKIIISELYSCLVEEDPNSNWLLHRSFLGTHMSSRRQPAYLLSGNFQKIKDRADRVTWLEGDLKSVLKDIPCDFVQKLNSGFSVLGQEDVAVRELVNEIWRVSSPGSKVLVRRFLSKSQLNVESIDRFVEGVPSGRRQSLLTSYQVLNVLK